MPKDTSSARSSAAPAASKASNYEEIRYEGYGIGGAAIIVDCMTDNRSAPSPKCATRSRKYGGNMGTEGSVAFLFKHVRPVRVRARHRRGQADGSRARSRRRRRRDDDDGSIEVITAPHDFEG